MFDLGVRAASNVFDLHAIGYVCPICLILHCDRSTLTEEHAPPKSIGGNVVCLTCRECNSGAGSKYEFMLKDEVQRRGIFGPNPVSASMELHGLPLRGNFSISGTKMKFVGHDKQNDPKVVKELAQRIRDRESVGTEIKIRGWTKFNQRLADIGYLKSAFLAAFARFGYRYAAHPALSVVRAQIRDPDSNIINSYRMYLQEAANEGRGMFVAKRPKECVVCKFGSTLVFLPVPTENGSSVYEWLDSDSVPDVGEVTFSASPMLDWPTGMEMKMDLPWTDFFDVSL